MKMNKKRLKLSTTPRTTPQGKGALQMALLGGCLSVCALQMAAPGAATAAPVGQLPGSAPRYFSIANYANSPLHNPADTVNFPGLRKFVDTLPGLAIGAANNLGQFIPLARPDTTTYPGSDYYEIAVVEYTEKMHSDLPPTKLRGYVQLDTSVVSGIGEPLTNPNGSPILLPDGTQARGVVKAHYLGPIIAATKNRPVRILFRNLLPTGQNGNLFIPTDVTVMGSGMGPLLENTTEMDPQNPMCGGIPKPDGCYSENRANLHMHGGLNPWISDGTPHQWITPAGETNRDRYKRGVSVKNVPDMPDPGPGAQTYFFTNQQSARMLFYHDHSWGITRLNVYAGEASAMLITDDTEKKLITDKILPPTVDTLPLVIQDKTFVPSVAQLIPTDPLWDNARWGGFGQLWMPHVYVPAQNPGDASGVNQFGRWAYGPWFWPPLTSMDYGPINNPYVDPACVPSLTQWCEPPLIPGTPFVSMGMEAYHDTPLVNGTAYPKVTLEPKAYRLRMYNAANDRFFNLSLYKADPAALTEVQLNPTEVAAALIDPTIHPTPVVGTEGPSWIQIASEGGFLPTPVIIPPQPITWVTDPTVFNAGNVDQHSLLIAPAERADVIVDFSAYAGQTLILYNDSPAAFPARDPRYDYYTGNGDYTSTGGAPPTLPGYGPNIRTVMQIKVGTTVTRRNNFSLPALQSAFTHTAAAPSVFESSQHPIIVGQGPYNSAYGTAFADNGPRAGLAQIFDTILGFDTVAGVPLQIPLKHKAIHDEMNAAWDPQYGRMSGMLGLEAPNSQAGLQQQLILYPFINPPTEVFDGIELPPGVEVTPISSAIDGTQIWKITHNGVDTHPIHFHLFDVQVINRVGWDGIIRKPEANELGWKETVRISPLEDTIVAMRPMMPKLPFGLPDSIRLLNPAANVGSTALFNSVDVNGIPFTKPLTNQLFNFNWEYVWHCHILSHEEMDMMRPISAVVTNNLPAPPVVTVTRPIPTTVRLDWTDGTPVTLANIGGPLLPPTLADWGNPANETGYRVERATVTGGTVGEYQTKAVLLANQTAWVDMAGGTNYRYRVVAINAVGATTSAVAGGDAVKSPSAPSVASVLLQNGPQIRFTWADIASNESSFLVERAVDGGKFVLINQAPARTGTGNAGYTDRAVGPAHSYQYRVAAMNAGGASAYRTSSTIRPPVVPVASTTLAGTVAIQGNTDAVTLTWNATKVINETGFTIDRATNAAFTVGLTRRAVGANTTTVTQTGLFRGVTYYFRIRSDNLGGSSAWSNVFSIITP